MGRLPNTEKNHLISIQEAAKVLGVSTKTLRRWEKSGYLSPIRTQGGHRRYLLSRLKSFKKPKKRAIIPTTSKLRPATSSQPKILQPGIDKEYVQLYKSLHFDQKRFIKRAFTALIAVIILTAGARLVKSFVLPIFEEPEISFVAENIAEKTNDRDRQVLAETTTFQDLRFAVNVPTVLRDDVSIEGELNLVGNTVLSSGDILIDPGGGGVNIGGATPANVDLEGDDLYVSGDIEAGGTIYGVDGNFSGDLAIAGDETITGNETIGGTLSVTGDTTLGGALSVTGNTALTGTLTVTGATTLGTATISTLTINSESITDLTGSGISISSGALTASLGTSIETSEITDGTILEVDLNASNSPTADYLLSYNSSTGGFTWISPATTRGIDTVQESDVTINTETATTIDFLGGDFDLTESPAGEINIQLATQLTSVLGVAGNFDVVGSLSVGTADAFQVSTSGGITIPVTEDITFGTIGLNDVGTSNVTSGASRVGVYDEFANSSATNIQDVLDDFDAAIGGGASKWTQDTGFIYLTNTTDDVVIGGSTVAGASLYFDEDAGNLYLGTNEALAGTLTLYSAGVSITDPTITSDASGNLIISSVNFDTTSTGINSTAIGQTTPAAGSFTTLTTSGTATLGDGAGDTVTISALTTAGPVITSAAGVLSSEAQLAIARGGTNASTVGSAGSVAYSNGSAYAFSAVGTSGQAILSGGSGAPTFTTGTLTLAGDFATAGANSLTFTTTALTNATIPSGTITLADLESVQTFTGAKTFNTTTTLTYAGTENLVITSNLAGDVDVISLIGTPSATAGTTRGIAVSQADSANSNGLDAAIHIDNSDTDLAIGDAILITNTGGGGFTDLFDSPSLDITGAGAITGATGITSSGTISFTGLATNGPVYTSGGTGILNSEAQLAIARGGTNSTATPTAGGVAYGTGTAYAFSALGSVGQCLTSNGAGTPTWADCTSAALTPFTTTGGVITKTTIGDYLSLRFGDAGDTQFEIQNTATGTIPTADAMAIDLTGGTTGIVTDGVDGLYIAAEFGNGTTNTNSGIRINIDPVNTPSGDETFYGLNIEGLAAGTSATESAINIGSNWDNYLNTASIDITGAGAITGATGISSSGTITLSGLTASRAVFTNGSSALVSSAASSVLADSITDETGSGLLVFGSSPSISDPTFSGTITTTLTASRFVATNASSELVTTGASADLLATLSDETGTGLAVFATSPSLTTPVIAGSTLTGTHDLQGTLSDSTGNVTIGDDVDVSGSGTFTLGASSLVTIDGSSTTNTGTSGILDVNLSTNASQAGVDISVTSIADAAADSISGLRIGGIVSTDSDNIYGIQISNLSGTATGGNEYGIYQAGTNWDYGALFEDDIIVTNQSDLRLGDSDGSNFLALQAAGTIGSNITWTLPSDNGSANQCLKTDGTGGTATLSWGDCLGGAGGGVTTVGSMTASSVFSSTAADDQWLGLGAAAGRIEFDDQDTDEINLLAANIGIGTSTPNARLHITPGAAAALQIDQYGTSAGQTGELRFLEGGASSTQYIGLKAPDSLTTNATYTLPHHDTTPPSADMVLTWQSGNVLEWKSVAGVGAGGDITDVGSITTGAAFNSPATADGQWLGLGAAAGRITFADDTVDEFNILAANVGIGTETPTTLLNVAGNFDLEGYGAIGNGSAIDADETLIINRAFTAGIGNSANQLRLAGNITENTSGTHATIAPLSIDAITVTDGGGTEAVTNLASLYIAGAPTAGSTPTNGPYAIFADAGDVRFDGQIIAGSTPVTLTLATGYIDADAITLITNDGGGLSFSDSGLETTANGLGLLQGCTEGQVLKWDDTDAQWECADDTTGATGIINVEENDSLVSNNASTIDYLTDFDLDEDPDGEVNVRIDYSTFGTRLATLNIGDGGSNTRIDIGGVDTDTGHTINIATNSTSADTLSIGNSNASTTLALTGGDDWSMSATGVLTMSASAAQTTAIDITDTDYTNALSIADNNIVGTTAAIDFTNFDVGSSGLLTLLGGLSPDITTQSNNNLTITANGTGDVGFTLDNDTQGLFNSTISSDVSLNIVDINSTNTAAGSAGTLNLLSVRNLNEAGSTGTPDSLVYLTNLDADETVSNGLFVEMATGGSTLSRGINITQSAGTLTDAIFQTGTVTNILNTDSIDISGTGAISGATGISSSGTIAFSGLTTDGVVTVATGTLSSEAQLATARGGLGANVTAAGAGEILYSTGTTTYDSLVAGSSSQLLISGGAGAPSWSNIVSLLTEGSGISITGTTNATIAATLGTSVDLTSEVTGILPLANGGTNQNITASAGAVVYSDADSFELTAVGSSGQCLVSDGTSAPYWTSCDSAATTPFTTAGGVITKTTIGDYLSLRFGDAADTQLEIQNTTTETIPTADAMVIDLTGGTTGIVTDGVDGLYIAAELGASGGASTRSGLHLNIDPVGTPTSNDTYYAINIDGLSAGTSATESAINIGSNWDNILNTASIDISGTGAITGATGISSSGTITLSGLTASRAVFTDGASALVSSAASSVLADSITDETGSGSLVFATAPTVTTLTVSSGGAAITGNSSITGTLTMTGNINANGGIDVDDAFVVADGGALTTSQTATFNSTATFNGAATFNTDADFTLAGTENIAITSDLAGTVNVLSLIGTPSASAGTTRGMFIQQANHAANTNGLDTAILIDNADADLALSTGIQFTNSGGGGFTNFLDTPSIDITGSGAITGATSYNGLVITADTGVITSGTWNGTTITVPYGGTGATTLTLNGVLYGNGTSAIGATAAGTDGQFLLGNTSAAPAFATMSGDATITAAGALTISADAVALGTDTTGNYIATITSTNPGGIEIAGSGSESAAVTLALGDLTGNWNQTGAYDIILNNTSSELQILGSSGTYFATFDAGALTGNKSYILPDYVGSSADICLSTGNCSGGGTAVNGSGTTGYVTFWQDGDTITGENMFVYDSANDVVSLGLGGAAADTSALLDIYGESEYMVLRPADIAADADTNNSPILRLRGTYDSDPAVGPYTSADYNFDIRNVMTAAGSSPASRLDFLNNAGTEVMSILSSGNVGIGDTTPTSLLTVGSSDAFQINSSGNIVNIGGVAHTISDSSGSLMFDSANNTLLFAADNTTITASGLTTLTTAANFSISGSTTISGGSLSLGVDGQDGSLTIYNDAAVGGDWTVSLSPSASQTQTTDYTLPIAYPGSDNYVLTSTTGGVMAWQSVAGVGGVTETGTNASGQIAYFTSDSEITSETDFTWTPTTNLFAVTGLTTETTGTLQTNTLNANTLTSGGILGLTHTASSATASFSGDLGRIVSSRTNSTAAQTLTDSGNLLDLSRTTITNDGTATTNVTGAILNITNVATQTLGTLADSSNLISVTQDADATGALLYLNANRTGDSNTILIEQSAGGTDILSLQDDGDLAILGDLTVTGGDIVGAATTNLLNAATTVNLGSTNIAREINIGTGTGVDTINIGTGGTGADDINIGSSDAQLALTGDDWSITDAGVITAITGTFSGANSLTVGTASTNLGAIIFYNSANGNTTTLQSGEPGGNIAVTLPTSAGTLAITSDFADRAKYDIVVDASGGGDYTTVTAALAAANAGDSIFIAPGTYTEANLTVPVEVKLYGAGAGATNIAAAATGYPTIAIAAGVDNVEIHNLTITNGFTANTDHGVLVTDGASNDDLVFNNIEISGGYDGIRFNQGNRPTIQNAHIHGQTNDGISFNGTGAGQTTAAIINNNKIHDVDGHAIDVGDDVFNSTISGNSIADWGADSGDTAIYLNGAYENTISSNNINSSSPGTGNRGLYVHGGANVINGNQIDEVEGTAIEFGSVTDNGNIVSGNRIHIAATGINLGSATETTVVGNIIENTSTAGIVLGSATNCLISGNTIVDATTAFSGTMGDGMRVFANNTEGNTEYIYLGESSADTTLALQNPDGSFVANLSVEGDVAVDGGDLTTAAATFNLVNSATTVNLGSTDVTRAINIGTGANADTINIGTGGTAADDINIGGLATTTIDIFGVTTLGDGGSTNYASFSATGDLTLVGSADTITKDSGNITLSTTTSGNIVINPLSVTNTFEDLPAAGGSGNLFSTVATLNAMDATGGDIVRGYFLDLTNAAHTGGSLYGIDIDSISGSSATEYAINIGSGWDNGIYSASNIALADGTLLDLSAILHDDTGIQGLKLPQSDLTTNGPSSGDGFLAFDTGDNQVKVWYNSAWNSISGASTTLQQAYNNDTDTGDTIIALTGDDDSLIFRNPNTSGTDSSFLLQLDQLATGNIIPLEINAANTLGNLIDIDWTGATSLTGAASAVNITASDITGNGQNFYGLAISDIASAGAGNEYGVYVAGTTWDYGVYSVDNIYSGGDITVAGGDITNGAGEEIDLGEETADVITFTTAGSAEMALSATSLYPTVAEGTALGGVNNEWDSLYLGDGGGAYFGLDQDWNLAYDEAGDDRLELITSNASGFYASTAMATGTGFEFAVDSLTSGTGFLIQSAPGGATTLSGALFRLNVNGNVTVTGDIFRIDDNGNELFSVDQSVITSALPHEFTAAGDVSFGYDINLTNQTAATIESNAPLTITAGEPAESNNLTLKTYNSGQLVVNAAGGSYFEVSGATVAEFNRTTSDGTIISLQQAGTEEGTISVSGTTVSYNAFTGSHYAWTDENIDRGKLVKLTGENRRLHNRPESEIVYGVAETAVPNDPTVLGAYLSVLEPERVRDENNPHLIMAVGNGELWVVDNGENVAAGDWLISSSAKGHAQKDKGEYAISYVVARAAEAVDWSRVSETGEDGRKHTKISVLFESFAKNNLSQDGLASSGDVNSRLALLESQMALLTPHEADTDSFVDLAVTDLTVLGDTVLGDAVVSGTLNVGTIQIDAINNSIDAIGTLKIQEMALGNIEFMGGLISFDTSGNVTVNEITANKYNVAGASAGTATLPAEATEIFIDTTAVSENSLIFVTPKKALIYPLSVVEKEAGVGFRVGVAVSEAEDVEFDWWIIDRVAQN